MSALSDAIEEVIRTDARLGDFERTADRRWVSRSNRHVRRIFEFQALKGNTFSARWGWSLDFCPSLIGRRLSWKRTASKADFDLVIDPIDTSGDVPPWCSFTGSDSRNDAMKVARVSLDTALPELSAVDGTEDIADLFESRSTIRFRRFSLENYVQTDLAWGLALLSIGKNREGEDRLDRFCADFDVKRDMPTLVKAQAEAKLLAEH